MVAPPLTLGNPQFGRSMRVVVNGVEVVAPGADALDPATPLPIVAGVGETARTGLDASFTVFKHNRIEPNTSEVTIFNLNERTRNAIHTLFDEAFELGFEQRITTPGGSLRIEAGYGGVVEQLARADIVEVHSEHTGVDWTTTIRAQDGYVPWRYGFISQSISPGVDASLLWNLLLSSWKTAAGAQAEAAFKEALPDFQAKIAQGGMVLHGDTKTEVLSLLESMKLKLTFQDGEIVLLPQNGTTTDVAVELNPNTGLLRRPTFKERGFASAAALLNPKLHPGRQVRLAKADRTPWGVGTYRVDSVEHRGSIFDQDFVSLVELRPSSLRA